MSDDLDATAEQAAEFAEPFEGFSATPYQDAAGVWTIGFGSTRDAAGDPVTADTPSVDRDDALFLVERDMRAAVQAVADDVRVPLTRAQSVALDDFVYNLGRGAFEGSTLLRKLNAGDYAGAAAEFDRWDHAGGRVLAGLLRRRQAETDLFDSGGAA